MCHIIIKSLLSRTSFCLILLILTLNIFQGILLEASQVSTSNFADPYKYGWIDESTRLNARDDFFLRTMLLEDYYNQKQSPFSNALKSAIAPGWGHFSVESYTKGQILLGIQLSLLGSGIYFREKANIQYNKYEEATQIEDINRYYNNAITPHRQSNFLLSIFFVVWAYTIYDTVLETNDYNDSLWNNIYLNRRNMSISIYPTSIQVKF